MKDICKILKELIKSWPVVSRIARYNNDQAYRQNYLGDFWHFADPALQIGIMILMFAVRNGGGNGNPHATGLSGYIAWIALGMVTYFFMQSAMQKSAKSIQSQINMLSRMKFSLSAIPMTEIITELRRYFVMQGMAFFTILFMDVRPSIYWIQFFYYFFAMIIFLYALSLVTSTITVLVPDFYNAYVAVLRVGMWVSGVIISVDSPSFPTVLSNALKLNPLYYIIEGFRETLLENPIWFWNNVTENLIFWGIVIILLVIGSHIHMRFRNRFMDFI
ncbi:ABC transporter permease [Weissella thailandensis]|uniref:ABC transporter permease n=1 Tax=Weissella thailandensis TaxID=89061 RepID=UPI0027E478B6|nr:ABC transporter permease [Weissella thailandensis]